MIVALAAVLCLLAGPAVGSAEAAPVNSTSPEVQGNAKLGERIVCASGSWSGGVSKFYFTWIRESKPIEGAVRKETPDYTLVKADEAHEIWCIVTAKNGEGEATAESWNSVEFGHKEQPPEAPKNVVAPEVSGTGEVGKELKCSEGTWSGHPTPTLSYQWLRDAGKAEQVSIAGATSQAYTVTSKDEGHSLSCVVTATNSAGSAFRESSNSVSVKGKPPKVVSGPKVEGIGAVGETLTCNHGEWTGTAEITYSYEWLLEGSKISGATGSTIYVEPSYEGKSVLCGVTAKNSVGEEHVASTPVKIGVKAPENLTRPSISGGKTEGSSLTCNPGKWTEPSGAPTYAYKWYRQVGESEEQLASETNGYTVVKADVGHTLFCVVTARNGGGTGTARSEGFVIPESGGEAPKDTGLPVISGSRTLSCGEGSWKGTSPIKYEYQWVRDGKVDIEGATHPTYTVISADEGHSLTCDVTATNEYGSGLAASEPFTVSGKAPVDTQAPSISGEARNDEPLTCEHGEWEGSQPIEYSYKWLRGGEPISGATTYVYTVQKADLGQSLTCVVTAKNSIGPSEARSPEKYVPGGAPEAVEAPTIVKEAPGSVAQVNENLTCGEGKWNGAPLEPSFEWLLNGEPIAGATTKNFQVETIDRGRQLICRVTEKNHEGQASADSAALRVAGVSPKDVEAPRISGAAALGQTLTCGHGIWEGAPPPAFSYQWYRDGVAIASATASTYTVESADQGHLLSCVVTAANVQGRVEAESSNGVAIAERKTEDPSTPLTPPSKGPLHASATAVRNALNSQLAHALSGARLTKVLKAGGYSFFFATPGAGTLEMQWYELVKGAHGFKRVVLASGKISYTKASQATLRLRLTSEGRRVLRHKRRLKLTAKAVFSVPGGVSVTWQETFVLSR
jgi:hypothetical protein